MRCRRPGSGGDEARPRPARDVQAVGHVIRRAVVPGHAVLGGPREVVVEGLAQRVVGDSHVGEGLVEAGDGGAVHLLVHAVAAVHADDG